MNFFEDKRNLFIIWVCVIILAAFSGSMEKLTDRSFPDATIKVQEKIVSTEDAKTSINQPLIKTFSENIFVAGHPYITFKNNFLLGFFAPAASLDDSVYGLLIICLGLIFLVRIKKLDVDRPFSAQLVIAFKWAGLCCIVFALLDYFRLFFINKYIINQTNNTYHLEHFTLFTSLLIWAGILLTYLYRILKKAEVLQSEQEFTV